MLVRNILGLTTIVYLATGLAAASSSCYYPNGNKNNGGACDANAEVSACCGPTFVCLNNGLCQPGADTKRTYAYDFYRSGCTDATFNSTLCPQFCVGLGYHNDRGQGVKSCGNNTYCCGASGDCCSDLSNVFALDAVQVITTISASSAYITDTANGTSASSSAPEEDHHALAIGLGVGIGMGGFLVVALAILYVLKRRAKLKRNAEHGKEEEVSELDASSIAQLPDASAEPAPAPTKVGHTALAGAVIHEIADGRAGSSAAPHELEANNTYDWEPRGEPEPRDGGLKPVDNTAH